MPPAPPGRVSKGYGLDFSAGRLILVRATGNPREPAYECLADDTPGGPAPTLKKIAALVRQETGAGTARLAAAMPAGQAILRRLHSPLPSIKKVRKVLPALLDVELPFPLEGCLYEFPEITPAPGGGFNALAVAARTQDLQAWLQQLAGMDFDPGWLAHESWALWQQGLVEKPGGTVARVVLCLGHDRCVAVWGRGAVLDGTYAARLAPAGQIAEAARRLRQVLQTQPLLQNVKTEWLWTGAGAQSQDTLAAWEAALNVDPLLRLSAVDRPGQFLARALGREALAGTGVNLRQKHLAHPAEIRLRDRGTRRAQLLALAAALTLCLVNAGWLAATSARQQSLQRALAHLGRTLTGLPAVPRGQEVLLAERAMEQRLAEARVFQRALSPRGPDHALLAVTAGLQAREIQVEELSVQPGRWRLNARAPGWSVAEGLAAELRGQNFEVSLERVPEEARTDASFIMQGAWPHE